MEIKYPYIYIYKDNYSIEYIIHILITIKISLE